MFKKIILTMFLSFICSFVFVDMANAVEVIHKYDPQNIITQGYRSDKDQVVWNIEGQSVVELVKTTYTDSSMTRVYESVTNNALPNYYASVGVSCPGSYQIVFKNEGGNTLASVKFHTISSDFADTSDCSEIPVEPNPTDPPEEPDPEPNPTDPPEEPDPNKDSDGDGIPDIDDEYPNDPDNGWVNDPVLTGFAACQEKAQQMGNSWRYLLNTDTQTYQCVLASDCMYDTTSWYCSAQEFDPDTYEPEEPENPYDRNKNGVNDYLEQDWDDPMTVQPYCDQVIPGKTGNNIGDRFGDHPNIPCQESDPNWYDLPVCDPDFIDWEACREEETPPWEEPYPELFFEEPEEPQPQQCTICSLFQCPGWQSYLGFLDDLVYNAIGHVEVPEIPDFAPAPSPPNIFDILNGVNERNDVQKPTGQEDPNLGNASFNANDIKNNAEEIQFREDPTGGFNITNPLETLPEDGSTAPRPQEELETLNYPGGSGSTSQTTPKPSNSGSNNGTVTPPTGPNDTITPPTTEGSTQTPTYGDTANYPTIP